MNEDTIYNRLAARSRQLPPNYDVEAGIHYGVLPISYVDPDFIQRRDWRVS